MREKIWTIIGFTAMGFMFFVVTIVIIKWLIDFVTWSTLDSGWAQAIGSVIALIVAICIMRGQNNHATRLLLQGDRLAMRRKALAVRAIIEHVHKQLASSNQIIRARPVDEDLGVKASRLAMIHVRVKQHEAAIVAIPVYELGSYHLAKAVHQYAELLVQYRVALEALQANPADTYGILGLQLDVTHSLLSGPLMRFDLVMKKIESGDDDLDGASLRER